VNKCSATENETTDGGCWWTALEAAERRREGEEGEGREVEGEGSGSEEEGKEEEGEAPRKGETE